MNLQEYVLTYRDANGDIVISVAAYYDRYVKILDKKFENGSLSINKLVLCCFKNHPDTDPSLGLMNNKNHKGVKLYHCFGCNATGDVIRLHQRIQKDYYSKTLSDSEACKELCKMFGVSVPTLDKLEQDYESSYDRNNRKVLSSLGAYTLKEYSREILAVRQNTDLSMSEIAAKVNKSNIKYISVKKKLVE